MPQLTGPSLAAVGQLTDVDTVQRNPLGTIQEDSAGNAYIYLQGAASVVATDWVTYDENFLVSRMDSGTAATLLGPVAVALAAVVASRYGWFQIAGSAQANAGDVADNARVYATSTAGRCDDAAVKGNQVLGAIWRGEETSNIATVQLARPWIGFNDLT